MMKRDFSYVLLELLVFTELSVAQPFKQLTTQTDSFPTVKVSFYDRNPLPLKKESIKVFREGEKIPFDLRLVSDSVGSGSKNVMILFENSYQGIFDRQRDYFQTLLKSAASDFFKKGDRAYLAEFSWTKRDGKTLIFQDSAAMTSPLQLNNAIDQIGRPSSLGQIHQSTEIYLALSEAIEFINGRKDNKPTCIILLSADFSNIYNSKFNDTEIIQQARKADVPIYCVRYDRWASKYTTKRLAAESYGMHMDADLKNPFASAQNLSAKINNLPKHYYGNVYALTVQAHSWPDGKKHDLQLELNGSDLFSVGYNSPDMVAYIIANPKLRYTAVLVILVLTFVLIFILNRKSKKRKAEKAAVEFKMRNLSDESAAALRQQEEKFKRTLNEREAQQKAAEIQKNMEALTKESMMRFSSLPRRPVFTDASGRQTMMDKLVMVVGRDASKANLRIDDASVSRFHANISFEQGPDGFSQDRSGRFFIWDAGSTNGTFVNEKALPRSNQSGFMPVELKNNDIIRFGNVSVTFNC